MALVTAQNLHLAYDRRDIVRDLDLTLPEGRVTIIVGANGCGKSTLLRGLSRLLPPRTGTVTLDGKDIHSLRGKELARRLGLLPQTPISPDGVTVRELVSRGRFPHQGLFPQWTEQDERAVATALEVTRTDELQERQIEELSGGQRQRAWIAMALAQETEVLLLDEPTTYLDVTHQLEVLDVVRDLNRERGTTVGIVLHDLNLAARYADHLIAVRHGEIFAEGDPHAVITEQMAREVFSLEARIEPDPVTGTPMVLPLGRRPREEQAVPEGADVGSAGADSTDPEIAAPGDTAPGSTDPDDTDPHRTDPESTQEDPVTTAPDTLVPALEHSGMLAFGLEVAAARTLGPTLRRLTLAGEDLDHFGCGGHPLDLRVKMIIPGPRPTGDHFAAVRPSGRLDPAQQGEWYREWLQIDPEDRGWMRTYTVREQRAAGHPGNRSEHAEVDVDFVLHPELDPAPGTGVAARWAQSAEVGDTITMLGPNRHLIGTDYGGIEFRPGTARTVLLAGDETALPAICSILEALPESIGGHALIEVPEAGDAQQILTRSAVRTTFLPREGRPHGERLDAEVRRLMAENAQAFRAEAHGAEEAELEDVDIDHSILWETTTGHGTFYAWLAGEAGVIKGLRRHLVSELGLDRHQVSFMGYWRQGRPEN